jgi:tetratricopeptide (TPR) repeat protein
MYNLANLYRAVGRYDDAERLHKKTLEIRRRILGQEHVDTLHSLNSLANVYRDQRRFADAEKFYRQILEIRQSTLGDEHPDTLGSMGNLAIVHEDQGQYDKAEQLHRRTLDIQRRVLGDDHPDTLTSMNNLAIVYRALGRDDDARQLHQRVLEMRRRTLGEEHPETLASMTNLANVYSVQTRHEEAEQLYEQALEIQRQTLGQKHPDTVRTMHNLAINRECQEDWESALKTYREVLNIAPDRVDSLRGLGACLERTDDLEAAAAAYRKAVLLDNKDAWTWEALARTTLSTGGAESVITTFSELIEQGGPNLHALRYRSWAYQEMGRNQEAIEDLLKAIELEPGQADPHRQLAEVRYRLHDWGEAAESMEKALELGLPVDPRNVLQLAICYGHLGEQKKGAEWYAQAVALMKDQKSDDSLVEMRGEAEKLLGIETPRTAKN